MNYEEFTACLRVAAQRGTSADPEGWSSENPLWGHCAAVSLLAQELYGGDLVRGSLQSHPRYKYLKSHYWNRINGQDIDFTREQYLDLSCGELLAEVRPRGLVLAHPDMASRYALLKDRLGWGEGVYVVSSG